MKKEIKKRFRTALAVLAASTLVFGAGSLIACEETNPTPNDPFGDTDIVDKEYDYTVTIIGTTTETYEAYIGDKLSKFKPKNNPVRSGAKFVGWYIQGTSSVVDWEADVTADITIEAKFETVESVTVAKGQAYITDDNGILSGGQMLALTDTFEDGVFSCDITPGSPNDCGVVFGVKPPVFADDAQDKSWWETESGTEYVFLLINSEGRLIMARVNPWTEVVGCNTEIIGFDATKTYNLKVVYSEETGKVSVYVNGGIIFNDVTLGALSGSGLGYRAGAAGVKFSAFDFNETSNRHVVTIDGAIKTTQLVEHGQTVDKPEDPVKEGFTFVGWFVDDSETEYDWSTPVTEDITITARFIPNADVGYIVTSGSVDVTDDGYKSTAANTLVLDTQKAFTKGTLTATVKPGTANDCGIVFGADIRHANGFEGFNYYTVLINSEGILFFSAIPWRVVKEARVAEATNFDPTKTYEISIAYNDEESYIVISVDGTELITATVEPETFPGDAVGFRSAADGVEFGGLTIDESAIPTRPAVDVGDFTVRSGAFTSAEGEGNKVVSASGSALAILSEKTMSNHISITMESYVNGDNGIVFALTDTAAADYYQGEGTSYYFFFITNGNARLSKIVNGAWNEFPGIETNMSAADGKYKFEVVILGNDMLCFVNGKKAFTVTDPNLLTGEAFGVRTSNAEVGVAFTYTDVDAQKAVMIDDGTKTTLQFVDNNAAVAKPADPEKGGYTFVDWYVGDSETPYDWSVGVTEDITITAKFEEILEIPFKTINGSFDDSGDTYKATQEAGGALMVLKETVFEGGSLEVTIKPTTRNDSGLIFGANVPESGADWENFDYFTVLINSNGTILFAKVNGWGVIASSPVLEAKYGAGENFPVNETYKVKVLYTDGYARVYAAKVGDEYMLAATAYIGDLKGTSVGFRAGAANTEFGKTVTVDEDDNLIIPSANTEINLDDQRVGSLQKGAEGKFTTTGYDGNNNFLALSSTTLAVGGCISVKMAMTGGDTGVIFGFTGDEVWEGTNTYYMLFLNTNGNVRAASFPWNQFAEIPGAVSDTTQEHTLTISYDGNGVTCFVDGVLYVASDAVKLNGTKFGVRGNGATTYSDWSVVDYSQITDNTLNGEND